MLDFGLLLLGFLGLVIVIGVPYLLVSHTRLKARVTALEAKHSLGAETASEPEITKTHGGQQTAQPSQANQPTQADQTSQISAPWGPGLATSAPAGPNKLTPPQPQHSPPSPGSTQAHVMPPAALDHEDEGDAAPRAFVFRQDILNSLSHWLRANWVLAIGAASLALAGVFLVQYGAENGLLTPFWRVMAALGFGFALIIGGEVLRRRFGDDTPGTMQHLPSALAGAGLIALFSGILSARAMYDLIAPGPSLAALCLIASLAMILGWFYGPFLSALGIIGASAAPFLVGGQSDATWVFYYYFAVVAAVGLAVDTIKRWAWISVLALAFPIGASWILFLAQTSELHFLCASLLIAAAAVVIPERRLWPRHYGIALLDMCYPALVEGKPAGSTQSSTKFPAFPTRLSVATICSATIAALVVVMDAAKPEAAYFGIAALVVLLMVTLIWMHRAPALYDHALIPGLAFLAVILNQPLQAGPLFTAFSASMERLPETAPPPTVWVLATIAALTTLMAFLRMRQAAATPDGGSKTPVFWALFAATYTPTAILLLEFFWTPAEILGAYPWALVAIATAAMMTLLAERTANEYNTYERALRVALFSIAALTLIALAFFLLLAKTALTLALAVMVLLTVVIDRKYDLPALGVFVQIGVAVITYRLIIDPGFSWATSTFQLGEVLTLHAPISQVFLAYVGTLCLLASAYWLSRKSRAKTALILESAIATIVAVFVSVLISRLLAGGADNSHSKAGLMAAVWAASLVNQLYRLQASGRFSRAIRGGLAGLYALTLLFWAGLLFTFSNPLTNADELVSGPPLFDTLFAAYVLLGAVFALAAWKIKHFGRRFQIACGGVSSLLVSFYVALEIRRVWRGDDLSVHGVSDPELYSYTLALLLTSIALLMLAFWRRSDSLRKLAMAGVVLTIAKVFLIDMSGLSGLTRVFSFMGLGLALVALAWLNRIMTAQWDKGRSATDHS